MQHSEASTEEILGIIKRVIERENREVAAVEKRKRESTGFSAALRAGAPSEAEDALISGNETAEVLDLGEAEVLADSLHPSEELVEEAPVAEAPAEETPVEEAAAEPEEEPEALTGTAAQKSVNDSFAALAMLARSATDEADTPKESPLEGMVREMLRPMLTEWLNENLPTLVEQLVREEIDRIAGKSH